MRVFIYLCLCVLPEKLYWRGRGGLAGKAGVPSELRARFSHVYLPLSTLKGTLSKAVVAPVTGTRFDWHQNILPGWPMVQK